MSGWDAYISQLVDNQLCDYAAIYGQDGTLWAASPGF